MSGRGGGGTSPEIPSFDFLTAGSIEFGQGKLASVRSPPHPVPLGATLLALRLVAVAALTRRPR